MKDYNLSGISVLVVDDSRHMRELLATTLQGLGIRKVALAGDGEDARICLGNFTPDVILLDIRMPRMDGITFTQRLRAGAFPADPFLPIVIVSGMADQGTIAEARDAGANEFLAKPISIKGLYGRIASLIDNPRDFVKSNGFTGPDRRRRRDRRSEADFESDLERRQSDRRGLRVPVGNIPANPAHVTDWRLEAGPYL